MLLKFPFPFPPLLLLFNNSFTHLPVGFDHAGVDRESRVGEKLKPQAPIRKKPAGRTGGRGVAYFVSIEDGAGCISAAACI